MLQIISQDFLPFITSIRNNLVTFDHILTAFRTERFIPILKKLILDTSVIINYQLVSLLSFLSISSIKIYLSQNNLLVHNQSTLKAAHFTDLALPAITEKPSATQSANLASNLILLVLQQCST